ncbi:MAG: hypothetical protein ETSY1_30820 [Candidatus Entotheonella factor]|uniref:Uncharacterized protein n=1 Tax=Entotheonella factor TaxID=1429438 RepID=W4LBD4_ENTF1|nr:MAG: hypothetical protein ETSY1_30820 [Candidatus Entotheonella factor]
MQVTIQHVAVKSDTQGNKAKIAPASQTGRGQAVDMSVAPCLYCPSFILFVWGLKD